MDDGEQKDDVDIVAWFDATLDADHWFGLHSIAPRDAAMLLCQHHPRDTDFEGALNGTNEEIRPDDLRRLYERFEDDAQLNPRSRKLLDWVSLARDKKLKYHSWVDKYLIRKPDASTVEADVCEPSAMSLGRVDSKDCLAVTSGWDLVEPERQRGYNVPLYRTLKKARDDGRPIPRAWEVLEEWRQDLPQDIEKIVTGGFDYYTADGCTENVTLKALRIAISRMTRKRE